jgi:hypothetical protein
MAKQMTQRDEMIQRLVSLQNEPANQHIDILTITGFMSDEQVATHLARYEAASLAASFAKRSPRERSR